MKFVLLACVAFYSFFSEAYDFGTFGNVFIVIEEDARKTFIKSAARADWSVARKDIKESLIKLKENKNQDLLLYPPNEDAISYIDPSITAQRDIYAPYVKDGELKRELLIKKGEKINPLEYFTPNVNRLFINSTDIEQIILAKKLIDEYQVSLQIIVVYGEIAGVEKEVGMDVFHSTKKLLDDNKIIFTPSLITVSNHKEHKKHLQVTSLARPFDITRLIGLITHE